MTEHECQALAMGALQKSEQRTVGARLCVMPCRSSRASICFRPRESCERSRRPSGASGGAADGSFGARAISAGESGFGGATGFTASVPESDKNCRRLGGARFLRSGLICFATLSHKACSSSLSARLRRDDAGNSGCVGDGWRFIGGGDTDHDNNSDNDSGARSAGFNLRPGFPQRHGWRGSRWSR